MNYKWIMSTDESVMVRTRICSHQHSWTIIISLNILESHAEVLFSPVAAQDAFERFGVEMSVAYVVRVRFLSGARHVAIATLVEVHMTSHMLLKQSHVGVVLVAMTALEVCTYQSKTIKTVVIQKLNNWLQKHIMKPNNKCLRQNKAVSNKKYDRDFDNK